jgi:hypothetical protein
MGSAAAINGVPSYSTQSTATADGKSERRPCLASSTPGGVVEAYTYIGSLFIAPSPALYMRLSVASMHALHFAGDGRLYVDDRGLPHPLYHGRLLAAAATTHTTVASNATPGDNLFTLPTARGLPSTH